MRLPTIPTNKVTCYTCPNVGAAGKDDATGKPIAWCNAKAVVVAPERGCDRHPLLYARTRSARGDGR